MALLSIPSATTPAEEEALAMPPRLASRVIGRWIPALVGLILAGLIYVESRPRDDLQLIAPGAAPPGSSVGLRALFFPGEQRPGEARLADVPVEVRLLTDSGELLVATTLLPSARLGREGALLLPEGLEGRHLLEARTALPDAPDATVRRPLDIRPDAPPLPRRGRLTTPLQRYELGPLQRVNRELAPAHLEPRVSGGACVPELPCDLLIWVGAPGATPVIEGELGEALSGAAAPPTQGVARRRFTVEGSDARSRVLARRGPELLAFRTLQLPVSLAAPSVQVDHRLVLPPGHPTLRVQSATGESTWVVDLFHEGHWALALSISSDARGLLPLASGLAPGLWTAQVRHDPFSSSEAGAVSFFVGHRGDSPESMLRRIAVHPRQSEWLDPMARGLEEVLALEDADVERLAAFMLASEERERLVLPLVIRGAEQSEEPEKLRRLRRYGAALVLLLGFIVSALLIRAELRAGAELESALKAQGIDIKSALVTPLRRWHLPLAVGIFVFLLFGVVAYIVVSRGSW